MDCSVLVAFFYFQYDFLISKSIGALKQMFRWKLLRSKFQLEMHLNPKWFHFHLFQNTLVLQVTGSHKGQSNRNLFHSSINVSVELEVDEPNHRHVADQAVDENLGLKREQNESYHKIKKINFVNEN